MGYIQELENEIRERLHEGDEEGFIKFIKDKIWESYKNGQKANKPARGNQGGWKKGRQFPQD